MLQYVQVHEIKLAGLHLLSGLGADATARIRFPRVCLWIPMRYVAPYGSALGKCCSRIANDSCERWVDRSQGIRHSGPPRRVLSALAVALEEGWIHKLPSLILLVLR